MVGRMVEYILIIFSWRIWLGTNLRDTGHSISEFRAMETMDKEMCGRQDGQVNSLLAESF